MKPRTPDGGPGTLLMKLIRILAPIKDEHSARLDDARWNVVDEKFRGHQSVAEFVCLAGGAAGLFLPGVLFPPMQIWDIGIGMGTLCCLPLIYIAVICYKNGFRESWSDFADFSTMKYSLPWNVQLGIFLFFGLVAVASVIGRVLWFLPINELN